MRTRKLRQSDGVFVALNTFDVALSSLFTLYGEHASERDWWPLQCKRDFEKLADDYPSSMAPKMQDSVRLFMPIGQEIEIPAGRCRMPRRFYCLAAFLALSLITFPCNADSIIFEAPYGWSVGLTAPQFSDALYIDTAIEKAILAEDVPLKFATDNSLPPTRWEIHINDNGNSTATVDIWDWQGVDWTFNNPPPDNTGSGTPKIVDTRTFSLPLSDDELSAIGQYYAQTVVPEPGSLLISSLGLAAIVFFRSRASG